MPAAARGGGHVPPLIAHVIFRLDVGGLENGVVNLINHIPAERFRHAVICLTDASDFRRRIKRSDVPVLSLHKPLGNSPLTLYKLWRVLRQLRPDIVHTRNLAALEATLPATLAGVPARIHGEHGRDVQDLDGSNVRRQRVRRLFRPFVHQYITVSRDLGGYLAQRVGVPQARIAQIYNGVDTTLFHPPVGGRETLHWPRRENDGLFVIGTVGRMQEVKDPLNLVNAFLLLRQALPAAQKLRLVIAGEGPLRQQAVDALARGGALDVAWLPGNCDDVPRVMRGLDLFVLPSLGEGISNTILEAMASGLPVVATAVGGNPELIEDGVTGTLTPAADPARLAAAIRRYVENADLHRQHAAAALNEAKRKFRIEAMVDAYLRVYDGALAASARIRKEAY